MVAKIIERSGKRINKAIESAANEALPQGRIFSPQNWVKAKGCLTDISGSITSNLDAYYDALMETPNGQYIANQLKETLILKNEEFEYRWEAD